MPEKLARAAGRPLCGFHELLTTLRHMVTAGDGVADVLDSALDASGYLAELVRLFGDDAIRTTRTHAKFAVITNDEWAVAVRTSMNLNENPRLESIEVSDDAALAGFLLRVVDEIFAEEAPGDYRTKSRPELAGMEGIMPQASVSMGRGVGVGV